MDRASDFGLAFLAVASGSSDALAFVVFGSVFTSAMTGNSALIGIAVGKGHVLAAALPLLALLGFICGAALATALCGSGREDERPARALRTLLLAEIGLLGVFTAVWHAGGGPLERPVIHVLVLLSGCAMGFQGVAARQINAPGINTIVVTSTLVSIVMSVTDTLLGRTADPAPGRATRRQLAIVVAYAIGATLAGLLTWRALGLVPWLPLGAVVVSFACCEIALRQGRSGAAEAPSR